MGLLYLGFFLWFMSTLFDFMFSDPQMRNKGFLGLWDSLIINFNTPNNIEFGISVTKLTGILWIVVNLVAKFILHVELGDLATTFVILAPVWIGAFVWEYKNH